MNYKPIIIILSEPYSIFLEIFFKAFKKLSKKRLKRPIVLIGSSELVIKQMNYFNYNFLIKEICISDFQKININSINIINVNLNFKSIFDKNIKNSNLYIEKCFKIAIEILNNKMAVGIINGPIYKKKFLKDKFPGITEYLKKKTKSKDVSMIIYNETLSVSPLTTHIPVKKVANNISKKTIVKKLILINNFYKKYLKKCPKIAVLGLNPHCETTDKYSEETKIIIPAIKFVKKKSIDVSGPYPADTFFLPENIRKFDLVLGMYHDQVLTPSKTLFNFKAINITAGLPFLRISPDHGPNISMVSKGKSDPSSLIKGINFFQKIDVR